MNWDAVLTTASPLGFALVVLLMVYRGLLVPRSQVDQIVALMTSQIELTKTATDSQVDQTKTATATHVGLMSDRLADKDAIIAAGLVREDTLRAHLEVNDAQLEKVLQGFELVEHVLRALPKPRSLDE